MLSFSVSFIPRPPVSSLVRLAVLADRLRFRHAWVYDSPALWQEVYTVLALIARDTERIRLGPFVTNRAIRDVTVTASALATLDDISGGRVDLGFGRGDSSLRVLGVRPATVTEMAEAIESIRRLCSGAPTPRGGVEVRLSWASGRVPPIWLSAHGPHALRLAGRVADGVIVKPADPSVIEWSLGFVREGATEAGRRFEDIKVLCSTAVYISDDLAHARDQARWYPAMLSNHVVDLVSRHDPATLPGVLIDYVAARDAYEYEAHGVRGAPHERFVTDEIVDRFCLVGPAEACVEKLGALAKVGVHEFNLSTPDVATAETLIATFAARCMPSFQ